MRIARARVYWNNRWTYATARNWEYTIVFGCASSTSLEIEIRTISPYSICSGTHPHTAIAVAAAASSITRVSFKRSNAKIVDFNICTMIFSPLWPSDIVRFFLLFFIFCHPRASCVVVFHISMAIIYIYIFFFFQFIIQPSDRRKMQDDEWSNERQGESKWRCVCVCVCLKTKWKTNVGLCVYVCVCGSVDLWICILFHFILSFLFSSQYFPFKKCNSP